MESTQSICSLGMQCNTAQRSLPHVHDRDERQLSRIDPMLYKPPIHINTRGELVTDGEHFSIIISDCCNCSGKISIK